MSDRQERTDRDDEEAWGLSLNKMSDRMHRAESDVMRAQATVKHMTALNRVLHLDNARLRHKLAVRSQRLGQVRWQLKTERQERDRGHAELMAKYSVLRRLAHIHFTEDEIERGFAADQERRQREAFAAGREYADLVMGTGADEIFKPSGLMSLISEANEEDKVDFWQSITAPPDTPTLKEKYAAALKQAKETWEEGWGAHD